MSDLCSSNSALFVSVFVEIVNPHGKTFLVGTVYHPPSHNLHKFLSWKLNSWVLSLISTFRGNLILVLSLKRSWRLGIIAKDRYDLSSKSLLTLYYSLVNPYLTYCNVAWSSTCCSNLNCIYLLQKRIVRLKSEVHYLANIIPLFSKLRAQ